MTKRKSAHVDTVKPLPIVHVQTMPSPEYLSKLVTEKLIDDAAKPARARFDRLKEMAKLDWGTGENARREAWIIPHPDDQNRLYMVRVVVVPKQMICRCPASEYTRTEHHLKIEACGALPPVKA
jgi:hypothetical protein